MTTDKQPNPWTDDSKDTSKPTTDKAEAKRLRREYGALGGPLVELFRSETGVLVGLVLGAYVLFAIVQAFLRVEGQNEQAQQARAEQLAAQREQEQAPQDQAEQQELYAYCYVSDGRYARDFSQIGLVTWKEEYWAAIEGGGLNVEYLSRNSVIKILLRWAYGKHTGVEYGFEVGSDCRVSETLETAVRDCRLCGRTQSQWQPSDDIVMRAAIGFAEERQAEERERQRAETESQRAFDAEVERVRRAIGQPD